MGVFTVKGPTCSYLHSFSLHSNWSRCMLSRGLCSGWICVPKLHVRKMHVFVFNHSATLICNTFSKYPFIYSASSKTADSIQQKPQQLISQYGPPMYIFTKQPSHPCSPHPTALLRDRVKTVKTALTIKQISGTLLDTLLLTLQLTPTVQTCIHPKRNYKKHPGQPLSQLIMKNYKTT